MDGICDPIMEKAEPIKNLGNQAKIMRNRVNNNLDLGPYVNEKEKKTTIKRYKRCFGMD